MSEKEKLIEQLLRIWARNKKREKKFYTAENLEKFRIEVLKGFLAYEQNEDRTYRLAKGK